MFLRLDISEINLSLNAKSYSINLRFLSRSAAPATFPQFDRVTLSYKDCYVENCSSRGRKDCVWQAIVGNKGRLVVPVGIRKQPGINRRTELEINVLKGNTLILSRRRRRSLRGILLGVAEKRCTVLHVLPCRDGAHHGPSIAPERQKREPFWILYRDSHNRWLLPF